MALSLSIRLSCGVEQNKKRNWNLRNRRSWAAFFSRAESDQIGRSQAESDRIGPSRTKSDEVGPIEKKVAIDMQIKQKAASFALLKKKKIGPNRTESGRIGPSRTESDRIGPSRTKSEIGSNLNRVIGAIGRIADDLRIFCLHRRNANSKNVFK